MKKEIQTAKSWTAFWSVTLRNQKPKNTQNVWLCFKNTAGLKCRLDCDFAHYPKIMLNYQGAKPLESRTKTGSSIQWHLQVTLEPTSCPQTIWRLQSGQSQGQRKQWIRITTNKLTVVRGIATQASQNREFRSSITLGLHQGCNKIEEK